ncbi:hypothetical protein WF5505_00032 [Escherichia phage vB_EcoS_WF5505]|uniref:Minor tail protein n=1 Tax=Escherichia phage vB_EcoS_WF5505 TaxID=2508186 RepID=A0A482N503_9CAUD|nr:hypothetical protein P9605_gp32 [Escherichia phage vB_EcoS_WF5505]QBQ80532.1 hypothetical protein WF5505_00032 [Escherichia phage vB_EcoS_WF5505]
MNKLYREATRFDPSGRVRLIHIDAQDVEPGDGAIGAGHHYFHYCFIPHTAEDIAAAGGDEGKLKPKSIFFGGQEFEFWPFDLSGLNFSTSTAAEPQLTIVDIGGIITRLSLNHDQLLGAKVEIIDTFAKFLDNGRSRPDSETVQEFYIDSQVGRNPGKQITFALSSPADMEGQVVPRRQIMNMCEWALNGSMPAGRVHVEPAQPGIKYYDERGNEVIAMEMDRCGGCLSDCYLRFGQGLADPKAAVLDYGGFPGSRLIKG